MRAEQGVCMIAGAAVGILLILGTLTSLFEPIAKLLPSRSHLFGHLLAHAVLAVAALHALPDGIVTAEAICAISIAVAFTIELAQTVLVPHRRGNLADVAAATVGSFAVFLFPRHPGAPIRPSWSAFTSHFMPVPVTEGNYDDDDDDDDDDYTGNVRDSHRVSSWAV